MNNLENQISNLKHRIKDFEETISDEKKEKEILIQNFMNKVDELESNISELKFQRERWMDELMELEEVK